MNDHWEQEIRVTEKSDEVEERHLVTYTVLAYENYYCEWESNSNANFKNMMLKF